jgi:DNA-binding transcriptional LysR family regulator
MHNVTGRDGLAMLRSDDVDFAVGSFLEIPDDIDYRPLFSYDSVLIAAVDHPLARQRRVSIEDVARHPLILPPRHLSTWRVVDLVFEQHGLKYDVALEAGGWEVIKKYVELGLGVAIVSSICLTGHEKLTQINVARYFPKRIYGVIVRKGKFLSPQAQRFLEVMETPAKGKPRRKAK